MDMCYEGALVMPSSYAVMDEEEMTYVEGGFSDTIFRNNLKGAFYSCKAASQALKMGGLSLGVIAKAAFTSAAQVYACYGAAINLTALAIGGIVAEIVVTIAIVAGIDYLGSHRVWY